MNKILSVILTSVIVNTANGIPLQYDPAVIKSVKAVNQMRTELLKGKK